MFICEIWMFECFFLNSANLICRSTDISKCFRGSHPLRDIESQLYIQLIKRLLIRGNGLTIADFRLAIAV